MPTTEQLNTALAGRYAIDREVGQGGMATVYLARDVRHQRKVALKVLRPDLGAVVGVERFLSEIQVTANLQHPNLLPLFDSGEADGLLFYVMPFVEGETLRARLEREKQLPLEDALHIATSVASALDYAHRHGVIHRDLKPENILLHDGQPVVADFGIALAVSNAGGNRITQTGLSLGTPQYMSPEQATGDRTIDARTDIYSLGAVVYEMLVGEAPHTGSTSQAIIARVLTEKPRTIRSSRPTVPVHVEAAIDHALEKLPADRWVTAKEFAEALTGARPVTLSATAPALATREPSVARSPGTVARMLVPWAIATAGVLVAAYFATRPAPVPVPAQFRVELPDSVYARGSSHTFAMSDDGTKMAILGTGGRERVIYLRRVDEPAAQPIRGTEGGAYHSFSPDGNWLLFVAQGALKAVPITGGTPQKLADSVTGTPSTWSPSGEVIYVARTRLWAVSSDGGNRRLLTEPDSSRGIRAYQAPSVLPDGKHALVSLLTLSGGHDSTRIGVVSLRDGKVTDLGVRGFRPQYAGSGMIVFARLGGLIYAAPFSLRRRTITGPPALLLEGVQQTAASGSTAIAVSHTGALAFERLTSDVALQSLFVVNAEGVARRLPGDPDMFTQPRVSPDGRRVAIRVGRGERLGLWVYDISAGGALTRLSPDSGSQRGMWTRDGSQVMYTSPSGDSVGIYERPWDASSAPKRLAIGPMGFFQQISIGRQTGVAALRVGATPNGDIHIAPLDSLGGSRPLIATSWNEMDPHVSPNGRLVAYTSNESGEDEVYVTTMPNAGPRRKVSLEGGAEPAWSSDGATLFYRGPRRMMLATIVEQPTLTVASRDSLFVDDYRRESTHAAYDVFPGKREFLMTRGETVARSELYVVLNWPQLSRVRNAGN